MIPRQSTLFTCLICLIALAILTLYALPPLAAQAQPFFHPPKSSTNLTEYYEALQNTSFETLNNWVLASSEFVVYASGGHTGVRQLMTSSFNATFHNPYFYQQFQMPTGPFVTTSMRLNFFYTLNNLSDGDDANDRFYAVVTTSPSLSATLITNPIQIADGVAPGPPNTNFGWVERTLVMPVAGGINLADYAGQNLYLYIYNNSNASCTPPDFSTCHASQFYFDDVSLIIYPATFNISGTVTGAPGFFPISFATITAKGLFNRKTYTTLTDQNGNYILYGVADTYRVTASQNGFLDSSKLVRIPPGTTVNLTLSQKPTVPPPSPSKPPLVLVHGWSRDSIGLNCNKYNMVQSPVEIVHYRDYVNNPTEAIKYWGGMPAWLEEDYDVWVAQYYTGKDGTLSLQDNGECLRNQINYVYKQTKKLITIVAHSTGGLVSRVCLSFNDCNGRVSSLITLGSPHAGLGVSSLISRFGHNFLFDYCSGQNGHIAVCQMSFDYMKNEFNAQYHNQPLVKYMFLGGAANPGIEGFTLRRSDGDNDGLVGKYSAVGWRNPNKISIPNGWDTSSKSPVTRLWTDEVHYEGYKDYNIYYYYRFKSPHKGERSYAYQCLKAWLNNTSIPYLCQDATSVTAQDIAPQDTKPNLSQITAGVTGHLDDGEAGANMLRVDTTGASALYLNWDTGIINFDLIRPDGQLIDPEYAAAHSEEVSYELSLGGNEFAPHAAYVFTNTIPGLWELNLVAGDTGAAGANYRAFAALETDRILTAGTDKTQYEVGQTMVLTAALQSDGTGISGATVAALLARPDGVTETLTLTDQGSGAYSTAYTIPDTPGFLPITITADGIDGSTPFNRQVLLMPTIAPHDAQLAGGYAEYPRDNNGDGLYETLEVTVNVTADKLGDYSLTTNLEANGHLVASTAVYTSLVAGTQSVTFQFDGDEIRASQLDGPYTLTNVTLVPTELGLTADSADNVWTTAAYSWRKFGSGNAIYLPLIVK